MGMTRRDATAASGLGALRAGRVAAAGTVAANDERGVLGPKRLPITRDIVRALVSDGKVFSVEFVRRSDGRRRVMLARLGVERALKGGRKAYDEAAHDLLTVFDMERGGYRSLPIEGIREIAVRGVRYRPVETGGAMPRVHRRAPLDRGAA